MWYMPCPKCGKPVSKHIGKPYQEDIKFSDGWKTVKRQKTNYDCSNPECDWTKSETRDLD